MESSDIPEGRGEGESVLSDVFCLNRFQAPQWPVSTLSAFAYMGPSRAQQATSDVALCLLSKTPCPHCPPKPSSGLGPAQSPFLQRLSPLLGCGPWPVTSFPLMPVSGP